jgi:hypothetical protein
LLELPKEIKEKQKNKKDKRKLIVGCCANREEDDRDTSTPKKLGDQKGDKKAAGKRNGTARIEGGPRKTLRDCWCLGQEYLHSSSWPSMNSKTPPS